MQDATEKTMLIAVRCGAHISVFERLNAPDVGYRCFCRQIAPGAYLDFDKTRTERSGETDLAVAQLLAIEAHFGKLDPARTVAPDGVIADTKGLDTPFGLSLALCFYADFFRHSLSEARTVAEVLAAGLGTPLDVRGLVGAMESALSLDCATWLQPFLNRRGKTLLAQLDDPDTLATTKGNGSYTTRLIADLEERLGRPDRAIAALDVSCRLGVNSHKLGRLILLTHAANKLDMASKYLNAYEKSYRLGPRLKAIKAELG